MERVVVGGAVLGAWHRGQTTMPNVVLVHLSLDPRIVLEDLAKAFGLSSEMVRRIRRRADAEEGWSLTRRLQADSRRGPRCGGSTRQNSCPSMYRSSPVFNEST